jgi:pimeloyl-ACP methyl ester carboxylesterase
MNDLHYERIKLPNGLTLNVRLGGKGKPIIFLHGFPESHRTWRYQLDDR